MTKDQKLIKELNAQVEKLTADVKRNQSSYEYADRERNELRKELDSIHTALDTLPGVPERKVADTTYGGTKEINVTGRLFAWIAASAFSTRKEKITD